MHDAGALQEDDQGVEELFAMGQLQIPSIARAEDEIRATIGLPGMTDGDREDRIGRTLDHRW